MAFNGLLMKSDLDYHWRQVIVEMRNEIPTPKRLRKSDKIGNLTCQGG